jgi:hypothetical protein
LTLHPVPLKFPIYEENFILFFISVPALPSQEGCRAGRYTHYTGHIQEHGTYCHKYALNSEDVFDKATFNKRNIGTNENETLMK